MERFTRQPAQTSTPTTPSTSQPSSSPVKTVTNTVGKIMEPTLAGKLLVVTLIITGLVITASFGIGIFSSFRNSSLIKPDQYQAVFLDNGQVYFGRLSSVNQDYIRLTDIYYLQVEQQIQPDQQQADEEQSQAQPRISLAKLGKELHGPEDEMFILRDKVVFWENLKTDGQVVKAITEFVQNGGQNPSSDQSTESTEQNAQDTGSGQ